MVTTGVQNNQNSAAPQEEPKSSDIESYDNNTVIISNPTTLARQLNTTIFIINHASEQPSIDIRRKILAQLYKYLIKVCVLYGISDTEKSAMANKKFRDGIVAKRTLTRDCADELGEAFIKFDDISAHFD